MFSVLTGTFLICSYLVNKASFYQMHAVQQLLVIYVYTAELAGFEYFLCFINTYIICYAGSAVLNSNVIHIVLRNLTFLACQKY